MSSISSSLSGNPYALTAGSSTLPPPPTCGAPVEGVTRCTSVLNGLTIGYAFGRADSLGLRVESQVTGTLPAQGARPELQFERSGTIWTQLLTGGSNTSLTTRNRSTERGVTRQNGSPRLVMTDTATTDIRMYANLAPTVNDRLPRLVGSSTRVVWTSKDGGAPTFWRETTTYDSSAVARSTITTPTGTRQCSIDLAATVIALTCR